MKKMSTFHIGEWWSKRLSDNQSGRWGRVAIILICTAAFMNACSSTPTPGVARETAPGPRVTTLERDARVRTAAERELGAETAASIPAVEPGKLVQRDPGAEALVQAMTLAAAEATGTMLRGVSLAGLRNFSHASAGEFAAMKTRLAGLLSDAATDQGVTFYADEAAADAELRGSVYLIAGNGFDLWEMFIELHTDTRAGVVWSGRRPVRMFRQPVEGPNQLLVELETVRR
jgi:hypothetical protein